MNSTLSEFWISEFRSKLELGERAERVLVKVRQKMKKALIVIDMTVEQWANIVYRRDSTLKSVQRVIASQGVFDVKIDSRLWIRSAKESSLWSVYPDVGHADSPGAEIIPELRKCDGAGDLVFVEKKNFSAFPGNELDAMLRKQNIEEVYLCGINTDYCVFATALDAFQRQYNVFVIEDAVTSVDGKDAHEEGISRAAKHFSQRCLVTSDSLCPKQPNGLHRA